MTARERRILDEIKVLVDDEIRQMDKERKEDGW